MIKAKAGNATLDRHLSAFARHGSQGETGDLRPIDRLRQHAFARLESTGLPDRRLEAWKFTPLRILESTGFEPVPFESARDGAPVDRDRIDALTPEGAVARLVFAGGQLLAEHSYFPEIEGLSISLLSEALNSEGENARPEAGLRDSGGDPEHVLVDLNTAFMTEGAVVKVARDRMIEGPIALIHLGGLQQTASHLRHVVELEAGSAAAVIECHAGTGSHFTNSVMDIRIAPDASLAHGRLQDDGADAVHISQARISIAERGAYESFALARGARLSRQESNVVFAGPDAHLGLYGAYFGEGHQHLDHTTRVDHAHPGCTTDELFRGVLDDHAHGVFQGLLRVAPHAIKTDARQKSQALLLSERAVADAKPELEILADDVKCAHGATIGDLDKEHLFYLCSRGIAPEDARMLLIAGFIGEVVEKVKNPALKAYLARRLTGMASVFNDHPDQA